MKVMNLAMLMIALLISVSINFAMAGVNLKNGNFFISYTDIVVPGGGTDLEITRTYNSKSTDKGWFGFGWGSEYETYLAVSADGSVVVHEHGAGAMTRFVPANPIDAVGASKKIVDAMRSKTTLSDQVADDLIKKLTNDAELRHAYAKRFQVAAQLAAGTVLHSTTRGLQTVQKTQDGYVRLSSDGREEKFDLEGSLVQIKDKAGYKIDFERDTSTKLLKSIKDSDAKQLFFSWYPDKKVKEIWSAGDKKATFKYKGDDLIESKNVGDQTYTYDYDRNHNMILVSYRDGSKMEITYQAKTQYVEKILNRNGTSVVYEYGSDPKNPDYHYWTTVTKLSPGSKPQKNRYEYEIKKKPDGSTYTYRIATEISAIKTETIYNDSNLPTKITRGKHVTEFAYNDKGLLTKKTSSKGENVELQYDEKLNKITYVKNNDGWTKFKYDEKGNLVTAVNSEGKSVLLIYDRKFRITKMVETAGKNEQKRSLNFIYNALGKPVEISMEGVGKINVDYDNYGEIKKVESKEGHKIALQVTQAFQSLLSIVKPAGVNLNF